MTNKSVGRGRKWQAWHRRQIPELITAEIYDGLLGIIGLSVDKMMTEKARRVGGNCRRGLHSENRAKQSAN